MSGAPQSQSQSQSQSLSGLVTALDNMKPMRVGENDHPEYAWNTANAMEHLVQIFFQCVRSSSFVDNYGLTSRFQQWVADALTPAFSGGKTTPERRKAAVSTVSYAYKMIAQLRDIEEGKGECRLAYDLLYGWYEGVKKAAYAVHNTGATTLADRLHDMALQTTTRMAHCFILPLDVSDADTTATAAATADTKTVQYGSFKDFKYICQEFALLHLAATTGNAATVHTKYVARTTTGVKDPRTGLKKHVFRKGEETFRFTPELMAYLKSHPVIASLASAYGSRIMEDFMSVSTKNALELSKPIPSISLAAKWAPRASSKLFGPLRTLLFRHVVPESELWKETAVAAGGAEKVKKAELKIDTVYRQRLSALNKALETVQVKQCEKRWADIDFDRHVTSVTLARQKKAFASEKGHKDDGVDEDRKKCAENFKAFMERVRTGTSTAKGKCVSVTDFVKEAIKLANNYDCDQEGNADQKLLIDKQWEDKGKDITALEDFIAMVDVSGSMGCDNGYPMNTAIGLGIRIAEKSRLGNRVMTFSATPEWVNLDDHQSFTDRVIKVSRSPWGMNTNFHGALRLILDAAVTAKLPPAEVGKLTLVVLSDMQIDHAGDSSDALFARIANEFAQTGNRVCGEPYPVPRIVFWNLRQTSGFPASSNDTNAIMVSGGSDALLNDICERGLAAIDSVNPLNTFKEILGKPRYAVLDNTFADWMV